MISLVEKLSYCDVLCLFRRTSVLPAFFVFGKASVKVSSCVKHLLDYVAKSDKPVMVCEASLRL